jgi:SAM-dependent methyltransferase
VSHPETRYAEVVEQLRTAYDGSAAQRDEGMKSEWKLAERRGFLQRLQAEGKRRLLEMGAGTGHDSLFFKDHGVGVVATDLSPEMVARCRAKGLEAHVMDFLRLDFPPESFDAAYAFNCLLHVPNADLPLVLAAIRKVLKPAALLYIGLYGGERFEGVRPNDWHAPPRFFSFRSDDQILGFVERDFEVLDFHVVEGDGMRFQSLTLRVPDSTASHL